MARIFGEVVRVSKSNAKTLKSVGDENGNDVLVEISEGGNLSLKDDDPQFTKILKLIESAQYDQATLYLETDGQNIISARPTLVGHVINLDTDAQGNLEVEISNSSAIHVLFCSRPRFEELAEALRSAEMGAYPVEIVDFRGIVEVRRLSQKSVLTEDVGPPSGESLITKSLDQQVADLGTVERAFEAIMGKACDVAAVDSPCIPFLYPTDYCWSRAHAMSRVLIEDFNIIPMKAWTRGRLRAATRNDPDCYVRWGWHVAPLVFVKASDGVTSIPMVFDPSMFDRPVMQDEWVRAQGDANVKLTTTDWQVYNFSRSGKEIRDDEFRFVGGDLRRARRALLSQISAEGPPPYSQCKL